MTTHTPGPWKAKRISDYFENDATGIDVADKVYWQADANLIATAPEMLEALEESLEESLEEGFLWSEGPTRDEYETTPFVLRARALIKKARGE